MSTPSGGFGDSRFDWTPDQPAGQAPGLPGVPPWEQNAWAPAPASAQPGQLPQPGHVQPAPQPGYRSAPSAQAKKYPTALIAALAIVPIVIIIAIVAAIAVPAFSNHQQKVAANHFVLPSTLNGLTKLQQVENSSATVQAFNSGLPSDLRVTTKSAVYGTPNHPTLYVATVGTGKAIPAFQQTQVSASLISSMRQQDPTFDPLQQTTTDGVGFCGTIAVTGFDGGTTCWTVSGRGIVMAMDFTSADPGRFAQLLAVRSQVEK